MSASRRRRSGYSLIELMVAAAILGSVLLYVFDIFTVQHQTYSVSSREVASGEIGQLPRALPRTTIRYLAVAASCLATGNRSRSRQ